jgi:hypothetical protein
VSDSNYDLILAITAISDDLSSLVDKAGSTLVREIRANARAMLGDGTSGYPYEYHNSFQTDKVVHYDSARKMVIVRHPAIFRIEYGLPKPLIIKSKNPNKPMVFEGKDGKVVGAYEVEIKATKPKPIIKRAIESTKEEISKKFGGK